jgi:ABC-type uncharacterized transport system permease subunit
VDILQAVIILFVAIDLSLSWTRLRRGLQRRDKSEDDATKTASAEV